MCSSDVQVELIVFSSALKSNQKGHKNVRDLSLDSFGLKCFLKKYFRYSNSTFVRHKKLNMKSKTLKVTAL